MYRFDPERKVVRETSDGDVVSCNSILVETELSEYDEELVDSISGSKYPLLRFVSHESFVGDYLQVGTVVLVGVSDNLYHIGRVIEHNGDKCVVNWVLTAEIHSVVIGLDEYDARKLWDHNDLPNAVFKDMDYNFKCELPSSKEELESVFISQQNDIGIINDRCLAEVFDCTEYTISLI